VIVKRKMQLFYVIIIIFFFVIHCDFAAAAIKTDGIDRSLLQNIVVEPLLGKNSWEQFNVCYV